MVSPLFLVAGRMIIGPFEGELLTVRRQFVTGHRDGKPESTGTGDCTIAGQ
jgi:hypothetical protein